MYIKGIMPGLVEELGDVLIVGLGPSEQLTEFAWSRAPNVRFVDCRTARYSLAEQIELPRKIPSETDLFFSPYYTIPLLYRGRLAVTVHDMSHLVVAEIVGTWKKRLYATNMFRAVRRNASLIFTVSEFSKSELLRLTHPGKGQIVPIHLGVSEEWYAASQLPRLRKRPYFVCVGNIKPYKNLGRLVEAFLRICDRLPHDLVIVGESEGLITGESNAFFDRIRAARGRVHLTGFVPNGDLLSLVGNAEALIMPSLYEGFGLPPLEAMAAGVPVVVANSASLPEVCGDAALYFDPLKIDDMSEKLLCVAADTMLRQKLQVKGLARSKFFTWASCSLRTASSLRGLLDSSPTIRQ